jgi:hypothetical protein
MHDLRDRSKRNEPSLAGAGSVDMDLGITALGMEVFNA